MSLNLFGTVPADPRDALRRGGKKVYASAGELKRLDRASLPVVFMSNDELAQMPFGSSFVFDVECYTNLFYIAFKCLATGKVVEFELSSVFDLMGVQLPYRQIIKNTCPWKYRGPECGYTGPYFDKNNQQTSMSGADYCTKRYDACNARRNYFADGVIHFGGFIGATRYG